MKKQYIAPEVTVYGDMTAVTQYFGATDRVDYLFGRKGNVVDEAEGSRDAIPTIR